MKKILTAVLIVAGLGVQGASVVKVKEGTLNFGLTRQYENKSNSTYTATSQSKQWSTATAKITSATVVKAIGITMGKTFTSNAKLVVEDGSWGGFVADVTGTNYIFPPSPGTNTGVTAAGKHQPYAYIFLKDGTNCINVSRFFTFKVQECYDCFYLNSFVTDSKFSRTQTTTVTSEKNPVLPPCCNTIPGTSVTNTSIGKIGGSGVDKYYFTLTFDNTINNANITNVAGITPLNPADDGVTPDMVPVANADVNKDLNVLRFTLNGILTYSWTLVTLNSTDGGNTQIGSVSFNANGYGFITKTCNLVSGTVSVSEVAAASTSCCSVTGDSAIVPTTGVDYNANGAGAHGTLPVVQ